MDDAHAAAPEFRLHLVRAESVGGAGVHNSTIPTRITACAPRHTPGC
jgi:hypothetical protein